MNPDIIFIDDFFDDTQPTEQQKENLRKFCEQIIRDRSDPPILKFRYHDKSSSENRNDSNRLKP